MYYHLFTVAAMHMIVEYSYSLPIATLNNTCVSACMQTAFALRFCTALGNKTHRLSLFGSAVLRASHSSSTTALIAMVATHSLHHVRVACNASLTRVAPAVSGLALESARALQTSRLHVSYLCGLRCAWATCGCCICRSSHHRLRVLQWSLPHVCPVLLRHLKTIRRASAQSVLDPK